MIDYGENTEAKIHEVVEALILYGKRSIIALAGVPGTGKSFIASIAAQRFATTTIMVREIQFHQSFSYEEFIEGLRIDDSGGVSVKPGIFLEFNQDALDDAEHRYVLLIEEFTRANLSAVLGELLTYLEYREGTTERHFETIYSRQPVRIAPNLTILTTYNPTDQSALELDSAVLRRLRIIRCPPSTAQLGEMLSGKMSAEAIEALKGVFAACRAFYDDEYDYEANMPFGHGVFADVQNEAPDLYNLWHQRLIYLLRRPSGKHELLETIESHYPWRATAAYRVTPAAGDAPGGDAAGQGGPAPASTLFEGSPT